MVAGVKFPVFRSIFESFKGFSANDIKWLALIAMTIDHMAHYHLAPEILYPYMRIIGRIAAPLFLFLITESIHHTKSKKKLLLRLYIATVAVGVVTAFVNFFFSDMLGRGRFYFSFSNFLFTLFFATLYILIIENIVYSFRSKKNMWLFVNVIFLIIPFQTVYLNRLFWLTLNYFNLNENINLLIRDIYFSFIQNAINVEYSFMFVIMGILIYYAPKKSIKILVFFVFCVLCFLGSYVFKTQDIWRWSIGAFFGRYQPFMVLAVPFMLFYNMQRGRPQKYFFYIYYPLHNYLLAILALVFKTS